MTLSCDKGKVRSVKRKGSGGTERGACLSLLLTLLTPCLGMSQAALPSWPSQSPIEGAACKQKARHHPLCWLIQRKHNFWKQDFFTSEGRWRWSLCCNSWALCNCFAPQSTGNSFYPSANFVAIYTAISPHLRMNQPQLEKKGIHTSAYTCMESWIKRSLFILHLLLHESFGSVNSNLLAEEREPVRALSRRYTQCAPVSASQCAPVSPGERVPLSTGKHGLMNEAGVGSGNLLRSALCWHQQELPSYF